MVNKGILIGIFFTGIVFSSQAQSGHVEVIKDSLITLLQEFRADNDLNPTASRRIKVGSAVNKATGKRVKVKGFRVQIFSGPNRNDAYAAQARFKSQYKNIDSYVNYEEPNYRVKVGDFRGRNEANDFMRVLRTQYSNVFVFVEDIWVYE